MNSKYQVFVSSTYQDLKDERDLVIKAILEMGHIPVGMEMFSAAEEEQWSIIKKQIDQSDYYIVIIAHKYGTCDTRGISYTEKEYDYAVQAGIPLLGFIIDDAVAWPKQKSEANKGSLKKLNALKEKVKTKPVSFWKSGEDLYGRCSIALMKAFHACPREGWVRASSFQDTAAAKEIVRLSSENAELRMRINAFESTQNENHKINQVISLLRDTKSMISYWERGATGWKNGKEVSLYQLFEIVAPELQVEFSLPDLARYIATNVNNAPYNKLRTKWPSPRNALRNLLADLSALDCVQPSQRKKPIEDKDEYWALSLFGTNLLAEMRRRRLRRVEQQSKIVAPPPKDTEQDA